MRTILVVTNDFADFKRGDQITDPAQIAKLIESGNVSNVVPVNLPEEPPAEVA